MGFELGMSMELSSEAGLRLRKKMEMEDGNRT